MPRRSSPFNSLAEAEERFISRAVDMERATLAALYAGTTVPITDVDGSKFVSRPQKVGSELLGRDDPALLERLRMYADFLSPEERNTIDRRAARAGSSFSFSKDKEAGASEMASPDESTLTTN
mgnify:CR=1 FL=1